MNRRAFLSRVVGLAAGLTAIPLPRSSVRASVWPEAGHRIVDLDLLDSQRERPVPARLYLPLRAAPGQAVPLVVFSHGLGGSRFGYRYLGSHWADQGLASLHPQHVGSDHGLWRGSPLELVRRLQSAASEEEALARMLDLRFALDQLLASETGALIDTSALAVAGHSYGANTAILVSGARLTRAGKDLVELRDHRIRSAILISAPPLTGYGTAERVLGSIRIPTLHVTSLEDTINLPGYRSTVEDRLRIFESMSRSQRTLAVFNTGGHSIFTDRITRSGPEISARIKDATRELGTLFLRQTLLRHQRPLSDGTGVRDAAITDPSGADPLHATEEHQPLNEWLSRHQDLVDRFVAPGIAMAAQ